MRVLLQFFGSILTLLIISRCADSCGPKKAEYLESTGDFREAISCYQSLVNSEDSIHAYERLSIIHSKLGDYQQALYYGDKVFNSDQSNLTNILNLGDWNFKTGRMDRALNYFLIVERSDSLFPHLNYNLALVHLVGFNAPKKARVYMEREFLNSEASGDDFALLGQIYFQLDLFEKSNLAYSEAIRLNQKKAAYYFQRAILKYYWEKDEEAIQDVDKALELDPDFVDALLLKIDIGLERDDPFVCHLVRRVDSLTNLPESLADLKKDCVDQLPK